MLPEFRLRRPRESDRSKIEVQLAKDERDILANTAQLDVVTAKINDLELRRLTSSPHVASEAVLCAVNGCVNKTIADALAHYRQQEKALKKCKAKLDATYDAHCEPLNELNRHRNLTQAPDAAMPVVSDPSEAAVQPARRLSLAW